MLGEVSVRFIALLRPFDRTQRPVYGGKVYPEERVLSGEPNAMKDGAP